MKVVPNSGKAIRLDEATSDAFIMAVKVRRSGSNIAIAA